ncbi:MAG: hypothetical protein ABI573_11675 [Chloroflexota bacterium]
MFARNAVRLLIGAVMLAVSACGSSGVPISPPTGPTDTPSATSPETHAPVGTPLAEVTAPPVAGPTVPLAWTAYRSPKRGFAIDQPADWTLFEATRDWPADASSYPDDAAIDKWAPPNAGASWVLMFVATQPLKTGEDSAARIARLDADNALLCELSSRISVVIDGQAARQEDGRCFGSDFVREIFVVHGGRSYLVYVLSGAPLVPNTLATFVHFSESFRFD